MKAQTKALETENLIGYFYNHSIRNEEVPRVVVDDVLSHDIFPVIG